MNRVCIDASVWIKVLTEEPDTDLAHDLIVRLLRQRIDIIAPSIMKMEVGSILRKKWSRKLLEQETMEELWHKFLSLPIRYIHHDEVENRAWEIANANQLIHLYDAVYLSLCDGIEFWTADARLVHSVHNSNAQIKLLGQN